mgnify:CR=1 FL=1
MLLGYSVLPETVPASWLDDRTNRKDRLATCAAPTHAAAIHPLLDNGLARCFYRSAANGYNHDEESPRNSFADGCVRRIEIAWKGPRCGSCQACVFADGSESSVPPAQKCAISRNASCCQCASQPIRKIHRQQRAQRRVVVEHLDKIIEVSFDCGHNHLYNGCQISHCLRLPVICNCLNAMIL